MKVIDVPIFNDDGSVKATFMLSPEEVGPILQFAMNFLVATGMAANYAVVNKTDDAPEQLSLLDTKH